MRIGVNSFIQHGDKPAFLVNQAFRNFLKHSKADKEAPRFHLGEGRRRFQHKLFQRRVKFLQNTNYILEIERTERATRLAHKNKSGGKLLTTYKPFPQLSFKYGKKEMAEAQAAMEGKKPVIIEDTTKKVKRVVTNPYEQDPPHRWTWYGRTDPDNPV